MPTNDDKAAATESDAQILWDDVVALLENEDIAPSTLAMFKSCEAVDLTDTELVITTQTGFVKRTVEKNAEMVCDCIERAAFAPLGIRVELAERRGKPAARPKTTISPSELRNSTMRTSEQSSCDIIEHAAAPAQEVPATRRRANPLVETITAADSRLTFDTFVEGEENRLALQAAKNVANGSHGYNPLFIYGKSGLGKTHLLKAIQNYLATNVPSRVCVYRVARDFVNDYTRAMVDTSRDVKVALERNYHDIDVLIIDDIQGFQGAAKSVDFFFDTFNYLVSHGKQIVLAADESPSELGMDERVASRLDAGVTLPIQPPNYELKYGLIKAFYERMKADAAQDGLEGFDGTIDDDTLEFMAKRAGSNIRMIKAFCQSCLLHASAQQARGESLTQEDVNGIAVEKWGRTQRTFTIEEIQHFVETRYGVSHADLVSSKRNKEVKEPRHIAIWLCRELTDSTLAQIGERFGGRTHATVKHSIKWVDDMRRDDRITHDKISRMREDLMSDG